MARARTGIEKAVEERQLNEAWAKTCDKAQILYNRNRLQVSSADMAEYRTCIVEAIVGEWIEAGEPVVKPK